MSLNDAAHRTPTAYYWRGETLRSRSVSDTVLWGTLDVPTPPARLLADWYRETSERMGLEAGAVEVLPLARTRMRWPDYPRCVQAVRDWTRARGLQELLASSEVALMACRGAQYHHDGVQYGGAAFCNLFLSEDQGLDLHFAQTGQRIALVKGTVVVFDTGQPHGVILRQRSGFCPTDFPPGPASTQVFLTWELPIENAPVAEALGITFDTDPTTARQLDQAQIWPQGAPASVCPQSGLWRVQDTA